MDYRLEIYERAKAHESMRDAEIPPLVKGGQGRENKSTVGLWIALTALIGLVIGIAWASN